MSDKWKKAFKKILDEINSPEGDSKSSDQRPLDTGLYVSPETSHESFSNFETESSQESFSNFETESSQESFSRCGMKSSCESVCSSLEPKHGSNNKRHETEINYMNPNSYQERNSSCNQSSSQPVKVPEWKKVFKQILGNSNSIPDVQEQKSIDLPSPTFPDKKNIIPINSSREKVCNLPATGQHVKVPEWNKAFRDIFKNTSSTHDVQEKKEDSFEVQEYSYKYIKDCYIPAPRRRHYPRNKQSRVQMEAAEKEVREVLARSSRLKLDDTFKCLNDFEGCGVDIFKCGKRLFPPRERELNLEDDSSDQAAEPVFPGPKFKANIKCITTADIRNAPDLGITEWWDDDF